VVLISYTALGYRMNCVRNMARTLVGIIPSIQDHLSAFSYVFTKFPDDQKQSINATALGTYNNMTEEEKDEGYGALLENIAEQTAKDVLAPDLLSDSRQELLKKLANPRNFIEDPSEVFQPFLTERS
ncbi:Helicase conserved domain containing protein, partial [Reticulomyxa filosa]